MHEASSSEADLILAIDQGTTSTRVALFDAHGRSLAMSREPHRQRCPGPGQVEHDPAEILDVVTRCAGAVLRTIDRGRIAGIGITNQRETIVVWDRRTGRPVGNAIVWQDQRTAARCEALRVAGFEPAVRARTGLPISPYFSATKLAWLLDSSPDWRRRAATGDLAAGTIDSWLAWSLTGAHITDVTNASRTLLCDTKALAWDEELLDLFGIPRAVLPEIVPTWDSRGLALTTSSGAFGRPLPLLAMIGDQQSALVGQACITAGSAKCTYGTGAFLLLHAGTTRPTPTSGMLASPAYQAADADSAYCVEGAMAVAGRAIGWLVDELAVLGDPAESEAVAASVPDSGGVRFVPAFQGLYAPWWDPSARGAVLGLSLHSTRAHVVRATIESLAFQTRAVVDAAERDAGQTISELRVDGGATRNRLLLQVLADVLGRPVVRAVEPEATLRGAAFSAGLAAGFWRESDLDRMRGDVEVVEPDWDEGRRETEYADWLRAVERARGWA